MANIVIDPAIITIPSDTTSREDVERWLEHLTIWLKEALSAPFTWLHYRAATELLSGYGQFPGFEQLRQLQRKYHLDINISQIASNINSFFREDSFDLETHLNNLEYAAEFKQGTIVVEPGQFIARSPEYLHDGFSALLASCCICKYIEQPLGQNLHLATLALDGGLKELAVSVVVLDVLPDFAFPPDNKIAQIFPLLITPDDLQPLINVIECWDDGERGIIYAIEQRCKKDHFHAGSTSPFLYKFRLGPRFIQSVNERGLDTNEILLQTIIRAASYIIADRAKDISSYQLHQFRQSETPDSPQLVREGDHAKAWRLMLQRRGAGWRLHYWQIFTPDGCIIEFANVGKESEREIY
ncbi:MAG TPA: hypothetical protein VKY19_24645 [Ktedonosporobacter sp.]|jgi:hypothetical protein|nr:hypothetical protein [Ktedonosporobacter sp.]